MQRPAFGAVAGCHGLCGFAGLQLRWPGLKTGGDLLGSALVLGQADACEAQGQGDRSPQRYSSR